MRVGILKPDHLGDLVLAAPAVAALRRCFDDLTLFCHPANQQLADHLFPGLPQRPVVFQHLERGLGNRPGIPPLKECCRDIDLLICLRWERELERLARASGVELRSSGLDRLEIHVAIEQRAVIAPLAGEYDLYDSYQYRIPLPLQRPKRLSAVGLCISAGFMRNAWPLNHWLNLALRLHERGARIVLMGGPTERARLSILAGALERTLGYLPNILAGDDDFGRFLDELAQSVDLVIATDSGTAHLAALVRPVVSLFGGSPWQRYAPLGPANVVLTRELECSPCVQFDVTRLNTCHTHECLTNLHPEQVDACLQLYLDGTDLTRHRAGVRIVQLDPAANQRVAEKLMRQRDRAAARIRRPDPFDLRSHRP